MTVLVERESLASRRIELLDDDGDVCMVATGFVAGREDARFLVSNRHVFTGRNERNELLTDNARIPIQMRVTFAASTLNQTYEAIFPLFDDDRVSTWRQHPIHGKYVDVAAALLPESLNQHIADLPITLDGKASIGDQRLLPKVTPGQTVFAIGFPFGANGGDRHAGIWVGATVATEPGFNLDGKPRFMIDGAVREGLSGAPVYAFWPPSSTVPISDPSTTMTAAMMQGSTSAMIGIYSGRLRPDAQLGFVWKLPYIEDILRAGTRVNLMDDLLG
ncbi:hypothetical protein ACTJJ4_11500 [Microbacterium sp. 22195]|uniref:hypothetical protein n=1 Tax=Microbacterium sp. 22195 TaxID=3453891 RepID=UPI003F841B8D